MSLLVHRLLGYVMWEYSPKAINLIQEYKSKFPELFHNLSKVENSKSYTSAQLFSPFDQPNVNASAYMPFLFVRIMNDLYKPICLRVVNYNWKKC